MKFYDLPCTPKHHGEDMALMAEKVIKPNTEEEEDKISAVGVTKAFCSNPDCRQKFLFVRNFYPGGWGPIHRIRDQGKKTAFIKRLKQARESDWVWGHDPETYTQVKVMVR